MNYGHGLRIFIVDDFNKLPLTAFYYYCNLGAIN
jgi:hypothetical protein